MADHPRKVIRTAVKDLLVAAGTDAEARVYPTRERAWRKAELPGISVFSLEEASSAALGNSEPKVLERTLQLGVLVLVSLTEEVDDALDRIADQVETAMRASPTFGLASVIDSVLSATVIQVDEESSPPIGAMRITYEVRYQSE